MGTRMQNYDSSSVQNNSVFLLGFFCPWKMTGHRFMWSWCLFNVHLLFLSPIKKQKTNALQKQQKVRKWSVLFYNNSSASCLHWFISRNNTLHLFLVPYPFKIEASLENSLSLQCTYLCIFVCLNFLEYWPGSSVELQQCCLWGWLPSDRHQQGLWTLFNSYLSLFKIKNRYIWSSKTLEFSNVTLKGVQ